MLKAFDFGAKHMATNSLAKNAFANALSPSVSVWCILPFGLAESEVIIDIDDTI